MTFSAVARNRRVAEPVSRSGGALMSARIESSDGLGEACDRFLDELGAWIHLCVRRYRRASPTEVHDQATYATSWETWVRARDPGRVRDFLATLRDKIARHFHRTRQWRHGYWRISDVHHGTEHFELFLGTLWRIDPDDAATRDQLLDAAEHFGNWSSDVPPWFDWDSGLFHSAVFGTDGVLPAATPRINVPDHLRCINLCLLAHARTGCSHYGELAARHGGLWANAIISDSRLPVALGESGPLYELGDLKVARHCPAPHRSALRVWIGRGIARARDHWSMAAADSRVIALQPPASLTDVDRAERFLASNGVPTFLRLWQVTGQQRFRDAAERLLDLLVTQLHDPDAGAVAGVLRVYRDITGHDRYDRDVLAAADRLTPWSFADIAVDRASPRYSRQPTGVGKRKDMVRWFEDGRPRHHSPALLALAADIRHDRVLATRAVDLARTYFVLATRAFPDGREHGCGSRSVSAVARGHGRDNDTGVVTGVLAPMLRFTNAESSSAAGKASIRGT
jgi:hypothetical protein